MMVFSINTHMNNDLHHLQHAYKTVLKENVLNDIIIKHDMPHRHEDHQCEAVEMAKTQVLNIMHNAKEMLQLLSKCADVEPWQASKLTIADDYMSKLKESLMFGE